MEKGRKLFSDTSLSGNGLSCATCHSDGAGFNATFAKPYPHQVAMGANQFAMDEVHLDEMIQICMVQPMQAEPLEWGGEDLAALVTFMEKEQEKYQKANPCAAKNPCAMKKKCNPCNPCAANPCASVNPAPKRRPVEVAAH
jgi:cytochrome c